VLASSQERERTIITGSYISCWKEKIKNFNKFLSGKNRVVSFIEERIFSISISNTFMGEGGNR
jgi:hypothetical protein